MPSRTSNDAATQTKAFSFEFHSPDMVMPGDVSAYAEDKLRAKLGKFDRVMGVVVTLRDVTGTKGGEDKACHIEALLAGLPAVNVVERHHDIRAALDIAVQAITEAVHRHVERARSVRLHEGRTVVRNRKLTRPRAPRPARP